MITDETLVRRSRKGDKEAFSILVERYQKKIYNLAYRLVSNTDDAYDITQEAFYRAYVRIKSFRGGSSFATWLYRIATNVSYDELRRRKNRPTVSIDDFGPNKPALTIADQATGPAEECLSSLIQQQLQEMIFSLPLQQRAAVVLRDIQGLSYDEISQILHCSLGTVKSRISRGRRALRDKLMSEKELFFSKSVYKK
ncbi:MAG TPA: sigma-70 family RNA polymerase sigma factor [bacterium]|jgi:RNA polymerase sigma-70 factor (ECF subfamily)|nr:sigma-70 family RNA polymerase sigma factor [bacterium]